MSGAFIIAVWTRFYDVLSSHLLILQQTGVHIMKFSGSPGVTGSARRGFLLRGTKSWSSATPSCSSSPSRMMPTTSALTTLPLVRCTAATSTFGWQHSWASTSWCAPVALAVLLPQLQRLLKDSKAFLRVIAVSSTSLGYYESTAESKG